MDNPKDFTPIFNYSDLHHDLWKWKRYPWFFQTVSHRLLSFFSLTKNNLLAGVSKGKCYPNSVTVFYSTGKIVSLGVSTIIMYVCPYVCGLLLRVSWRSIHRISSSGAYQSDSLPPRLVIKNHTFHRALCVSPVSTSCHLWDLGACKKVWGHYR